MTQFDRIEQKLDLLLSKIIPPEPEISPLAEYRIRQQARDDLAEAVARKAEKKAKKSSRE